MLALQKKEQAKKGATDKPETAGAARDGQGAPAYNSIWQSLALRPFGIQRKMTVSQPGDPDEREADHIADQVMRMPEPRRLQRACACGGSCQTCKTGQPGDEHLRAKRSGAQSGSEHDAASPLVSEAIRSPGQRLDPDTRAFMESRFGHDFSHVRVHTGTQAAQSARAVDALAYTLGSNVVFGAGQYAPATSEGRRLLAHELTHVAQQAGGAPVDTVRRATISGCNKAAKDCIERAIPKADADLDTALGLMRAKPITDHVKNALWMAFRNDSDDTIKLVTQNLTSIKGKINGSSFGCQPATHKSCGETGYGFVPGDQTDRSIYLCMPTFCNLDMPSQSKGLIHEATHRYLGLADRGYFAMPGCVETAHPASPGFAQDEKSGTAGDNPVFRLENADAYACFVYYLVHTSAEDVTKRAAGYKGENLKIESMSTLVYTRTNAPSEPTFTLEGVPPNSGFTFLWRLNAGGIGYRLESARTGDPSVFSEDVTQVYVSNKVRSILASNRVRKGTVECVIKLFSDYGDRFEPPQITKTFEVTIIDDQYPFDMSLF
ncbi:MAG: DUF4157 domain-containing protein [Pyrinomonadaceae bacterium]